jgi:hypothetical protein
MGEQDGTVRQNEEEEERDGSFMHCQMDSRMTAIETTPEPWEGRPGPDHHRG